MEDYSDIVIRCLEVVQNRYKYMMCKYPNISCELLDLVMRVVWMDIDYLLNKPQGVVYEPCTYHKYILVSKTEYGIKKYKLL